MKVKVVVFNHNQLATAEKLYSSLSECFDVALLDSGSNSEQLSSATTHSFKNLFWTGCWNKSWELFADYDVIWGVGGDCTLGSSPADFKEAIHSVPAFGIWSPAIIEHSMDHMKLSEPKVLSVKFVEGIAFALSKNLWTEVGRFDPKNYFGWGLDAIHSYFSHCRGMRNILDGRVQMNHAPSDRYNHKTAEMLMFATMKQSLGDHLRSFSESVSDSRTVAGNTLEEITPLE